MAMAAWLAAVGVAVAAGSARGGEGATIEWMYDPHPDAFRTEVWDVCASGDIAVGYSVRRVGTQPSYMFVPLYWDRQRVLHSMPLPDGVAGAVITCISDDGRVFGGIGDIDGENFNADVGIIWTQRSDATIDMQIMPMMFIESMNTDGSIRVGTRNFQPGASALPCVWYAGGDCLALPMPPQADRARASSVSDDGTIVGDAWGDWNFDVALRWRTIDAYEFLDSDTEGQPRSHGASHITPNGGIIGGNGRSPIWTDDVGWHGAVYNDMNDDDPPPMGVTDSTPDGQFMVGANWGESCSPKWWHKYQGIAAVWDAYNGTRYLDEVLFNEYGLEVGCLFRASGVSSDGRVVVGTALATNGWERGFILTLPPPCTADTNADNLVDGRDLSLILSAFGRQTPPGLGPDLNGDGIVNGSDLSILLFNFGDPC